MYASFDPFLSRPTWHTSHALDDNAFFDCLATVISHPDFSPEKMGQYFSSQEGTAGFKYRIDELVTMAWAIKGFIGRTGGSAFYGSWSRP
ncbi:hypothetical protein [Sinorhizobium fredii]|uniref:hypothetical protein n=1 Tax=Rhizobium fredii TaxID=380 RepID=UPI0035136651